MPNDDEKTNSSDNSYHCSECNHHGIPLNSEQQISECGACGSKKIELYQVALEKKLYSKNLLEVVNSELGKKIEGEQETRKAIFLFGCIRLVKNRGKGASNALLINAKSSSGKDYVSKAVCEMHPSDKVHELRQVSAAAFTYYKADVEGFTWDGQICRISDITDRLLKSDVFKTFLTDEGKSVITNKNKSGTIGAHEYSVKGKPVIIATTANAEPEEELLNRVNILPLDETSEQTRAINRRTLRNAATGLDDAVEYDRVLVLAIAALKEVKVVVPFAELLLPFLPEELRSRRDTPRILNLIKASAALHQKTRVFEGNFVVANAQDYENARQALKVIQTGSFVSLTRMQKELYEIIKKYAVKHESPFTAKELHNFKNIASLKTYYTLLDKLAQLGLIVGFEEKRETADRPVQVYRITSQDLKGLVLPPFDQLTSNSKTGSNASFTSNGSITPLTSGAIEAFEAFEVKKHIPGAETGEGQAINSSLGSLPFPSGKEVGGLVVLPHHEASETPQPSSLPSGGFQ